MWKACVATSLVGDTLQESETDHCIALEVGHLKEKENWLRGCKVLSSGVASTAQWAAQAAGGWGGGHRGQLHVLVTHGSSGTLGSSVSEPRQWEWAGSAKGSWFQEALQELWPYSGNGPLESGRRDSRQWSEMCKGGRFNVLSCSITCSSERSKRAQRDNVKGG